MDIEQSLNAFWTQDLQSLIADYDSRPDSEHLLVDVDLDEIQVKDLSQRIEALPDDLSNALLFRFYFGMSPQLSQAILDEDQIKGKAVYAHMLLSYAIGIPEGFCISEASMGRACKLFTVNLVATAKQTTALVPHYSKPVKKNIREHAKARWLSRPQLWTRRVAMFFLVVAIGFTSALVVHAGFREAVLNWLEEKFPLYSTFISSGPEDNYATSIEPAREAFPKYVPDGFVAIESAQFHSFVVFEYMHQTQSRRIDILISIPGDPINMNTEGAQTQTYFVNENTAIGWELDGISYLLWHDNGYELMLTGNINIEEAIQIAESIIF